jgi:hypothetical protein
MTRAALGERLAITIPTSSKKVMKLGDSRVFGSVVTVAF